MSMTENMGWANTVGGMGQCSKGTSKMTKSKLFVNVGTVRGY